MYVNIHVETHVRASLRVTPVIRDNGVPNETE